MEIKDFSAKDICNIIEKCGKFGVRHLKIGEIEVRFDSLGVERSSIAGKPETTKSVEPVQVVELSTKDKTIMEQWRVAQDMIDDPVIYEQSVIDTMLEDNYGRNEPKQAEQTL